MIVRQSGDIREAVSYAKRHPNFSKVSKLFAYYAKICDFLVKFAFK